MRNLPCDFARRRCVEYKSCMTSNDSPIVIICALKEELAAIKLGLGKAGTARFELIQAGIGARRASAIAKQLSTRATPPTLVISTGFCGGLSDELKLGDLVAAHKISAIELPAEHSTLRVFESARGKSIVENQLIAALQENNLRYKTGGIVCTREPVSKAIHKRTLGTQSGALAVDMESYALAENLDPSRTTLIALRAVSDTIDDELPAEVGEFLDESGKVRLGKITRFVLRKPGNVSKLMGLGKRANAAAKSLSAAWRALREVAFD